MTVLSQGRRALCSYQTQMHFRNRVSIMGEEKPEEELMGKRKSSPRLSATPLRRYVYSFPMERKNIHAGCVFLPPTNFTATSGCVSI